jgi:hypothetical protein
MVAGWRLGGQGQGEERLEDLGIHEGAVDEYVAGVDGYGGCACLRFGCSSLPNLITTSLPKSYQGAGYSGDMVGLKVVDPVPFNVVTYDGCRTGSLFFTYLSLIHGRGFNDRQGT